MARGQNSTAFYQKIEDLALKPVTPIVKGEIDMLKDIVPPEGTWKYSKLESYKEDLNSFYFTGIQSVKDCN